MLNSVTLIGRLTEDPVLRRTRAGTAVCSFRIAVERTYTPRGKDREADFITISAWRGAAEFICRYFGKGELMAVQGSIRTGRYTDKQGGIRTSVSVLADSVFFAGGRRAQPAAPPPDGEGADGAPEPVPEAAFPEEEALPVEEALPMEEALLAEAADPEEAAGVPQGETAGVERTEEPSA